ncbi:MAG: excinuclease ABC subunit C [Flavobacteriales bacterium]|nr:excinuclease ABC subunit C [Flavobacteriales bacterium]
MDQKLKNKLSKLPGKPGIYKYFNSEGKIIYIGKAKNIKKRVSSYFTKQQFENRKTEILVSKIADLEFTVVNTEIDALLLENSLIKEFKPKYNINLKDDKSFPLIRITNERFPKVYAMRNPIKDGSEYFGPYSSPRVMHIVLELVKKLYPIRNCNFNLSEKNIVSKKFNVCLEYQIGNCKGPCEGLESEEEYMESIKSIKNILRGNLSEVKVHLKSQMMKSAKDLRFEEAEKYKNKIEALKSFQARTTVVNHKIHNVDVFNISISQQFAFVNYLKIANGMIIQTHTIEYRKAMDETESEILEMAILEMRLRCNSTAPEIITPVKVQNFDPDIKFLVPKAGDKLKLLQISMTNLLHFKKEKLEQYDKTDPELRVNRLMEQMKEDLKLSVQPRYIECFDNSNLQGSFPVSACVVFRDGKPSKKDYRIFNIKTVEGPNDFASMDEAVSRRYTRLLNENQPLPDLLIIDGGKGQLSSTVAALKKTGVYGKFAVVGIAKRLEEIYYPEDPLPLYIDKKSETLKIIQQLRDEAHRFGITRHRNRRSKGSLGTELVDIKGIGKETARTLLKSFKSVKNIRKQPEEELEKVIGKSKTKILLEYLSSS